MQSDKDANYTDAETGRRLDAALKKSLQMKPKPHNPKKKKGELTPAPKKG